MNLHCSQDSKQTPSGKSSVDRHSDVIAGTQLEIYAEFPIGIIKHCFLPDYLTSIRF